jgi:hypothetical protein
LGSFVKNYRSSTSNLATFVHGKINVLIFTKTDWPTFWATFSQTHLVTLDGCFKNIVCYSSHYGNDISKFTVLLFSIF